MAEEASKRSLIDHFSALKDPRQAWKVIYPLPEIMLLVLCATRPCCTDQGCGRNDPDPVLGLCDADGLRASQL
jgi:hypothetical protein